MIQIGSSTRAGAIDDPLQHLTACHRRIEQRLDTLERAGAALATRPAEALEAIRNCITFFDVAGHLHTMDEEESIFPLIRPRVNSTEAAFLDRLEADHLMAEAVYDQLKRTVEQMGPEVTLVVATRFQALTADLCSVYRAHIASEDSTLMSIIERVIRADERPALTEAMRLRRQPAD
jgi:hemerythrin-like domain-containing protein